MNTTARRRRTSASSLIPTALICCVLAAVAVAADAGPPGKGVPLDGKTAYSVPAKSLDLKTDSLTVSAWVKLADPSVAQVFVNCGKANSMFTFYAFETAVRMLIGPAEGKYAYASAPLPAAGAWTHYLGTFDGKQIKIYLNGELKGTAKQGEPMQKPAGDVFIGALDATERYLTGALDDVCIWNRPLAEAEVALVAAGKNDAGVTKGLLARWAADGASDEKWDAAGNGPSATRVTYKEPEILINRKDDGYRGVWYMNQPSNDEYVYKYSGGMATYCANHNPHSWYVKEVNKTFFTYGGTTKDSKTHLIHMVSYFDHATGTLPRPTILLDKQTEDAHDNPVLNIDEKGYIWIFSSSHGRGRPSYISRSTKPYSIDSFELVWTGNFSYPQPWHFPGQGFLLMHTYYNPGRSICMMTSPDGINWTDRKLLSYIHEGHYQISRPGPGGKVGTFFNHHPQGKGLNWRTNVYYMESDDFGKTWKAADGTPLTIPLKEIDTPALVHDYTGEKLNMYTQDLAFDSQGRPALMYITSKGYESGPKNGPRPWMVAYWNGSKWEINGGDIESGNNYDLGPLYIEADETWRIIGPTQLGPQPYNPGGEIAMWTSADHGKRWQKARQMTQDSPYNHAYVRRPVNAHPDFYAIWADGHGRQPSDSRLYFCNKNGDVFRMPVKMTSETQKPELVK